VTVSSFDLDPRSPATARRAARWIRRILRLGAAGALVAALEFATSAHPAGIAVAWAFLALVLLVGGASAEGAVLRFLPLPLRTQARQSILDGESAAASARLFRRGSGNPVRPVHVFAAERVSGQLAARPRSLYQSSASEILWTGDQLKVTDARGGVTRWSTTSGGVETDFLPAVLKSRRTVRTAPPTGDALVAGLAVLRTRLLPVEIVVLQDRHSRRVGLVPVLGYDEADLAAVAKRAGIEYSLFELPNRFGRSAEVLTAALFPMSVRFRWIAGVPREWGPLTPLRNVLRFVWAIVSDGPAPTPMVTRRD
jgi:hypothetical protein